MAEVSGLMIGAVGLASLFTTCVDLFECFELGRNYAYDYQLACTKICLLKVRFLNWGTRLRIGLPGLEDAILRWRWHEEQEVVKQSLFGIKDIFENASQLAQKYQLIPSKSSKLNFRRRTLWAIHDKKKFDGFIADLSFLIDNLEKVVDRLNLSKDSAPASQQFVLKRLNKDRDQANPRTFSQPHIDGSNNTPRCRERAYQPIHIDVEKLIDQSSTRHIFIGDQCINSGVGIMGNVGKLHPRNVYIGGQAVTSHGFAVMGDISSTAAKHLSQHHGHEKGFSSVVEDAGSSEDECDSE